MNLDKCKSSNSVKIKITLLSSMLFLCFFTLASEKSSIIRAYELSSDVKNIRIQAHHAHIRLFQAKGKKKKMKVQYYRFLEFDEENSTLVVSEDDFPNKKKSMKNINKRSVMTVWAPSLPVRIVVFGGKVEINKFWKTDLFISMSGRGVVQVKNTAGNLNVFQREGDILIDSHKGDITVQAENSRVQLQSCKGQVKLSSFKGRIEVNKSSGHLSVRSFKSPLVLNKFTGRLEFRQEKAGVYLKPMIGSVFGYSKEGEVRGVIHPSEVNIETKAGRIHLDLPYSQAWVTAETWEGRIVTPVYFNRVKTGGMDRSKGRLRGKKREGNVSLKSRSGSIRVYQSVN